MAEVDFEKLEKEYQKNHEAEEYKGKQDYARRMSMQELDEYVARKKESMRGAQPGVLLKMGQDSLAYTREYQGLLDNPKKKTFRKVKAAVPKE